MELRLFGDIAFNARGLDIGSNSNEFWLGAKPKQLGNSFFWGEWNQQNGFGENLYPVIFLDAFGSISFDNASDWSLSNNGPFDILTQRSQGKVIKKIYIYCCDYRIRKIEYFDSSEIPAATLELWNYSNYFEGCSFASQMLIRLSNPQQKEDSFKINFGTVKSLEYTNEKKDVFFQKPANLDGFENIYQVINGKLIKQ